MTQKEKTSLIYNIWEFFYGLIGAVLTRIFNPDPGGVDWIADQDAVRREIQDYEERTK